jgi:hypothetical protein
MTTIAAMTIRAMIMEAPGCLAWLYAILSAVSAQIDTVASGRSGPWRFGRETI